MRKTKPVRVGKTGIRKDATREEKMELLKRLLEQQKLLNEQREALKREDPFWFFEPTRGKLPEDKVNILRQYVKAEHIPERVDSQMDVLLSTAAIVGVSGGNRAGKTLIGTIRGIIKSTGELPKSLEPYRESAFAESIKRAKSKVVKGRVVAVDFKQLHRVVLDTWKQWVPRDYLKNGKWSDSYSAQHETLSLYRGGEVCATVQFMTNQMDVESFQGDELDWCIFDEEPVRGIFKECKLRFLTAERLDIEIDWTPTKGLTWATEMFHDGNFDGKEEKIELFKLCTISNHKVNLDVVDQIASECETYDEMLMRFFGEAVSLSGLIYGNSFNHQLHVCPPFPVGGEKYMVYRGLDPHLAKPTVCVELAVNREGQKFVVGTYSKKAIVEDVKADLAERVKAGKYRLGRTICDRSANAEIEILQRNVFRELGTGKNAIPALTLSEKFTGSIHAGVDQIKKDLKVNELTGKPTLMIFDIPENKDLIAAFKTLERETYANEDKKGMKDRIAEGKHDAHAALRYIYQTHINWIPEQIMVPEYQPEYAHIAY